MSQNRPRIPSDISRKTRQRCGFGCVICGNPLFTIEHIVDWAIVKKHEEDNLTLLCWQHQMESKEGLLPKDDIRNANKTPFNLASGYTPPYKLHYSKPEFELVAAGMTFKLLTTKPGSRMCAVLVDHHELLGFKIVDGLIVITRRYYDRNRKRMLTIVNNELVFSAKNWDSEFISNRLTIRNAPRKIEIKLVFDPPNRLVIESANFYHNGVHISFNRDHVIIGNRNATIQVKEFGIGNKGVVFNLGNQTKLPSIFSLRKIDRYYWK